MGLLEILSLTGLSKLCCKLESIKALCPNEFLIFDHFFEMDDQDQISYTIGIPYEIFGYPLKIHKQFLPFLQTQKDNPNYFLFQRATQLLQESAKAQELSMIYFSDDGEEEFIGFSSILWSYHPGHGCSFQNQMDLTRKLTKLLLNEELEVPDQKLFTLGELGHIGIALRSGRKIVKYYLRTDYLGAHKIITSLMKEANQNGEENFNFLLKRPGKTIIFLDVEGTEVKRFGVEVRPDILDIVYEQASELALPDNIVSGHKIFDTLSTSTCGIILGQEKLRFHHLKLSVSQGEFRWKAYYAYNVTD